MGKSCPGKESHPPSQDNFSKRLELTTWAASAFAHALIVLPYPSWPVWTSQSVYMELSGRG